MPSGVYQHKKGRHHTEESRKKISEGRNEGKYVKYICENCREEFYAFVSRRAKFCSRKCFYEMPIRKETRDKMSKAKKGKIPKVCFYQKRENHPRWIKDRTRLKKEQERNDSAYLSWVKEVKKRDNNTCKMNNKNCSGYNIVHHIKNWEEYLKLRYKLTNGITLCQAHHPRRRAEEKRLIPLFERLVSVSS